MAADGNSFDRLLTAGDVLALTGYRSRTTLWRKVRAGGFSPRPARAAPRACAGARPTFSAGSRGCRRKPTGNRSLPSQNVISSSERG
jgi:predicted DNA-binding transcriptional regulator AlpA